MDEISPECMIKCQRKARKDHVCCECRRVIKDGIVYEFVSGIWDHEPSSFKTCTRCVVLRAAYAQVVEPYSAPPPFTCLFESIRERVQDEGHAWAVKFKSPIQNLAKTEEQATDLPLIASAPES